MRNRRIQAIIWLLAIPSLCAQADRVLSETDGNFTLQGRLQLDKGQSATLRFRARSGLGYQIQFGTAAPGRLEDPGRRPGVLAAPLPESLTGLDAAKGIDFRLTANGPALQLDWNGKKVWAYNEREAGVASSGAVLFQSASGATIQELQFMPLPPTPPSFAERYGPGIGEPIPAIRAVDQDGKPRDFASLRGPKGLWLYFFRSADW